MVVVDHKSWWRRVVAAWWGVLIIGLAGLPVADAQSAALLEYQVKAAFLYNFAKYVEWPPDTMTSTDAIHVCVLGESPFDGTLEQTLHGKVVHDKPLLGQRIQSAHEGRACQILFVSSSELSHLEEILQTLADASVLTVGDVASFAEQGGMISFRTQNGNVRFEINLDSAQRAGLKISSQLLKLAVNVIGRPPVW